MFFLQADLANIQHQHIKQGVQQQQAQSQRHVVRSDGRVLVLPPIEKPATRSSKRKQDVDVHTPSK